MSRRYAVLGLIVAAAVVASGGSGLAASPPQARVAKTHKKKKHHKAPHHKSKHHKTTPPKSTKPKLEGCSATIDGGGPVLETNLYYYQVIIPCEKGEFGSFTVSTNRTIAAGTITAQIGSRFKYTCQETSSTSFSCRGVNVSIPPEEEGAIRAFFKSPQAVCTAGAAETATIATQGLTLNAKIGEAQSPC